MGLPVFRMLARMRRGPKRWQTRAWNAHQDAPPIDLGAIVAATIGDEHRAYFERIATPFVRRNVRALCEFVWHDDSNTITPLDLGFVGTHFPKSIFCDRPATGIVIHYSHTIGRVASHDYCAEHGRLMADKVAATVGTDSQPPPTGDVEIEVPKAWQDDAWNYAKVHNDTPLVLRFQHGDFSRHFIPDASYVPPSWHVRAWRWLRRR